MTDQTYKASVEHENYGGYDDGREKEIAGQSFRAGAEWERARCLEVWKHEKHVYCDFFYDGLAIIDSAQKADWLE